MSKFDFDIELEDGKTATLMVRTPDVAQREEADKVYASKVAEMIRESGSRKLLLRSQLNKFLSESGVWTKDDEANIAKLTKEIDDLLSKLRRGGLKLSEGRDIAIKITDKRAEMVNINRKRQLFDESTIESVAENERLDYLVYVCTVYSDTGNAYWESFEALKADKLSNVYAAALTRVYEHVFGYSNEFEKRLPENRWLKKHGFIDDDLRYVDRKTGKFVDRSGRPAEESDAETLQQIANLQGEIHEEVPFIDDETGQPVTGEEPKDVVKVEEQTVNSTA